MIAKLIVRAPCASAIQRLRTALEHYEIVGPITNIEFLKQICVNESFLAGEVDTNFIEKHRHELSRKHTPT
jgi:3-methylcrotonyl-CoA carboxylase alpha subunit